jgi:hypothetical protein
VVASVRFFFCHSKLNCSLTAPVSDTEMLASAELVDRIVAYVSFSFPKMMLNYQGLRRTRFVHSGKACSIDSR